MRRRSFRRGGRKSYGRRSGRRSRRIRGYSMSRGGIRL